MPELHLKAYLLRLLQAHAGGLWDYAIVDDVLQAYGYSGAYWRGAIRVMLAELFTGGLISEIDARLDDGSLAEPGRALLKYQLTPFGRQRMLDTGIAGP